jgi:hypothetical protein
VLVRQAGSLAYRSNFISEDTCCFLFSGLPELAHCSLHTTLLTHHHLVNNQIYFPSASQLHNLFCISILICFCSFPHHLFSGLISASTVAPFSP